MSPFPALWIVALCNDNRELIIWDSIEENGKNSRMFKWYKHVKFGNKYFHQMFLKHPLSGGSALF